MQLKALRFFFRDQTWIKGGFPPPKWTCSQGSESCWRRREAARRRRKKRRKRRGRTSWLFGPVASPPSSPPPHTLHQYGYYIYAAREASVMCLAVLACVRAPMPFFPSFTSTVRTNVRPQFFVRSLRRRIEEGGRRACCPLFLLTHPPPSSAQSCSSPL